MVSKSELLKETILKSLSLKKLSIMKTIVHDKAPVSLRLIEHFVTKFSREKEISYNLSNAVFRPYDSYKYEQIKAFNKKLFDVYRRTKIFKIQTDKGELETTVAQLNFFNWLFKYKILDYILEHKDKIQKDLETPRKRNKKTKKNMSVSRIKVTIHFD